MMDLIPKLLEFGLMCLNDLAKRRGYHTTFELDYPGALPGVGEITLKIQLPVPEYPETAAYRATKRLDPLDPKIRFGLPDFWHRVRRYYATPGCTPVMCQSDLPIILCALATTFPDEA